jgi:putative phage-type endonuclease
MRRKLSPLRKDRVTASRLPAVLGVSPYLTRAALMRQMVREHFGDPDEFAGNIATEWGQRHEDQVVAEYELTRGVLVDHAGDRQITVVHPAPLAFLAATPDGILADRVLEVKAPWRSLYTSIEQRPDYYAQLQVQMACTGLPLADLVIWRPEQPLVVDTIEANPGWLADRLPVVADFLNEYREVLDDPERYSPHREPLRDVRTDDEWAEAATEWLELDFLYRQLAEAREAAAARLAALSPVKSARGAGIDLQRYERKGAVPYSKVLKDLNPTVDLDRFRGAPTTVVAVKRVGDNQKGAA